MRLGDEVVLLRKQVADHGTAFGAIYAFCIDRPHDATARAVLNLLRGHHAALALAKNQDDTIAFLEREVRRLRARD